MSMIVFKKSTGKDKIAKFCIHNKLKDWTHRYIASLNVAYGRPQMLYIRLKNYFFPWHASKKYISNITNLSFVSEHIWEPSIRNWTPCIRIVQRVFSSLFDWVKKSGDDNNFIRKSAVEATGRERVVSHGKSGGKDLNFNLGRRRWV